MLVQNVTVVAQLTPNSHSPTLSFAIAKNCVCGLDLGEQKQRESKQEKMSRAPCTALFDSLARRLAPARGVRN